MSDSPQTALMETRVIDPSTGEIRELGAQTEVLAELLMAVRERQKVLKDTRAMLEAELTGRMYAEQRSVLTAGNIELRLETRNESVWDSDELEFTLQELIDDGVIQARDVVGVIKREPVVSRSAANRLVKQLLGEARHRVEACRHWQKSATAKLELTRTAELIPAEPADPTAIEDQR